MADTAADVVSIFRSLPHRLRPDRPRNYAAVFHWTIREAAEPLWTVSIHDEGCDVTTGHHGDPVCKVEMSVKTFLGIETGQTDPVFAFVKGRVRATNVNHLRRYDSTFYRFHDVPAPEPVASGTGAHPGPTSNDVDVR